MAVDPWAVLDWALKSSSDLNAWDRVKFNMATSRSMKPMLNQISRAWAAAGGPADWISHPENWLIWQQNKIPRMYGKGATQATEKSKQFLYGEDGFTGEVGESSQVNEFRNLYQRKLGDVRTNMIVRAAARRGESHRLLSMDPKELDELLQEEMLLSRG